MKILVLGAGGVGKAVVHELYRDHEVSVGDIDSGNLKKLEDKADTFILDIKKEEEVLSKMEKHDIVIGALPGEFGYRTVDAAIESGTDIVDVSFMPEDPLKLRSKAEENDVTAVVDAGFGPGMSNVLMGRIAEEIDRIDYGIIRIGGLPKDPKPPLYYKSTWSTQDLIEEYTREARMKRDSEVIKLDPLNEINEVKIREREFEEFYSDGLRTLLDTIDAETLEETTLRWEGHLEKMKVLRELGFFKEENVKDTLEVITPHMKYESDDFSIMDIHVEGKNDGKDTDINYFFYDEADDTFSSMSRSTGFTTAIMARLMNQKDLPSGVLPPERLGRKEEYFDFIVERIRDKGIKIERY